MRLGTEKSLSPSGYELLVTVLFTGRDFSSVIDSSLRLEELRSKFFLSFCLCCCFLIGLSISRGIVMMSLDRSGYENLKLSLQRVLKYAKDSCSFLV